MSSVRWMNFGAGLTTAVLVACLVYFARQSGAQILRGGWAEVVVIAISAGVVVGLSHALWMSRYGGEVRAMIAYVRSIGRADGRAGDYRPKMGLDDLAAAIDAAFGDLRRRVDHLTSERRDLEVQVRIAEVDRRQGESILNAIHDAVIVTDVFNEVVMANDAAARALAFDPEQARRKPVDRVVTDTALIKAIKDTREGGVNAPRRHLEYKVRRDGRTVTYEVQLSCINQSRLGDDAPESAGVVTVLRDITWEKQVADMKSDFVSNVSHELKTPLSSIKAYMEMLVDGEARDDHARAEFYIIIQGETNRLHRLIDNILNINRIESGIVKVQREMIPLASLVKEVIDVLQPQARAKQIRMVDASAAALVHVYADKDMIYQTILNLAGNAIKYTNPGGVVTVTLSVDDPSRLATVAIADTGVGIPPDAMPFLFDKFYRVNDHKKLAKGTGLGLNLVKHIVETVHGGKVNVTSEVGKGSTFTFTLPQAEGSAAS